LGFSGGGTNILKAHKHTSAVQDGGKLDMDNVTEAELTQGDVIFSDGNALQRLAIGAATNALVVNGAATGPEWVVPVTGATVSSQSITPTSGQTETLTTFQDVANASITLPTRVGGVAFISAFASVLCSAATNVAIGIYHGGSLQEIQQLILPSALAEYGISVTAMQPLDGSLVKMMWKGGPGTKTMVDVANFYSSRLQTYEVS